MLELYANASADGLPVEISHFAAANGVRYRALAQQTSPDCQGKLIREGGHIVVDVPSLVGAVSELGLRRAGRAQEAARAGALPVLAECLGRLVSLTVSE